MPIDTNEVSQLKKEIRGEIRSFHKDLKKDLLRFEDKFDKSMENYHERINTVKDELSEHRVKSAGMWGKVIGAAMVCSLLVTGAFKLLGDKM